MENWLKKNKDRLSIRAIEKEIGCPASTLTKVVNNAKRKLPEKWVEPLMKLALDMAHTSFTIGYINTSEGHNLVGEEKSFEFNVEVTDLPASSIKQMVAKNNATIKGKKQPNNS